MSRSASLRRALPLALLALTLTASGIATVRAAADASWFPDGSHTEINFSVKHFFTPVTGNFDRYEVDLDYDAEHPEKSSVKVRIEVASVNTGNAERDQHLRTVDFFDADAHPEMTFRSTSVRMVGKDQLIATGPLTIKGISREIELPISLLGTKAIPAAMQPMLGGAKQVASFRAGTTIDRGDFEVGTGSWAATLVVGSQVDIEILLEVHNR